MLSRFEIWENLMYPKLIYHIFESYQAFSKKKKKVKILQRIPENCHGRTMD